MRWGGSRVFGPVRAILWAQWRAQHNLLLRSPKAGALLNWVINLFWYGLWMMLAVSAALMAAKGAQQAVLLEPIVHIILLFILFLWQLFPFMLAASGASLDLKRLLVYPVPPSQLFLLELALRFSAGLEMLLVLFGLCVGLLWNPLLPWWAPAPALVFGVFNLLLSCGLKALLDRMLQRKWVREILVGSVLLLVILPPLLTWKGVPPGMAGQLQQAAKLSWLLPSKAVALLATGQGTWTTVVVLAFWTVAAYWIARAQFAGALRLEEFSALPGGPDAARRSGGPLERLYRAPSLLFRDPLAAVMEQELRLLFRSPRFRLVAMMSCALGSVFWLPMGMQSGDEFVASNYLPLSVFYIVTSLTDTLICNVFGMERGAAQVWFVTPVGIGTALRAKNLVAAFVLFACLLFVATAAALLPVPVGGRQILDAFAMLAVIAPVLIGMGNLASVSHPRAVDPRQTLRNSSSGWISAAFLLLYAALSMLLSLASLARWALDSDAAFYAVMAVNWGLAVIVYRVATKSALETAEARKEEMISALTASQREGPISIR
jgi:ABC-2 type transport system permease protein